MSHVNFDDLIGRFDSQIYATTKGRLRMRLIDSLYRTYVPLEQNYNYHVLDAGGGLGQMTHWFLEHGAQVDYFDISKQMVNLVNQKLKSFVDESKLTVNQSSILKFNPTSTFDFVNVHAVLEWLEDPMSALESILSWVKPGGYVGLMVYNKHMLMLRHLMRGTLKRAMEGRISGDRKGLTPISPMNPAEVHGLLMKNNFEIVSQAGIRTFSDLAEKTVTDWYEEQDVFQAELDLCEERPYCDIGRYVLFIARKNI